MARDHRAHFMFGWLKQRRRRKIQSRPFPRDWEDYLRQHFPLYNCLPDPDRDELHKLIQVFLAEKHFEGCGGFVMTDEARILIAAQACLLLLRRPHDYFHELRSILVYPTAFQVEEEEHSLEGIVTEAVDERLGESWDTGAVVLAWDAVVYGASDPDNGENLVLHEFAHQLDQQAGEADGAPLLGAGISQLGRAQRYRSWARTMTKEFERHQDRVARNRETLLDEYGSTHPAEFFAVATECFFEQGRRLKAEHPKLYRELKTFFRQDPASWRES